MKAKYTIFSKNLDRDVIYNFIDNGSDIYIYFFDGQNLYDKSESYMNAVFDLEKALDKIGIKANMVGLYSPTSFERTNEYTPYTKADPVADLFHDDFTYNPKGDKTGKFIVDELITVIEKENPAKTRVIGGASLGGLMSLYMGAIYPEYFDKILAMSSHFNINIIESGQFLAKYEAKNNQRVYIDVGDREYDDKILSASYVDLNKMAYGFIKDKVDSKFIIGKGHNHHEDAWAERLPGALEFLLK